MRGWDVEWFARRLTPVVDLVVAAQRPAAGPGADRHPLTMINVPDGHLVFDELGTGRKIVVAELARPGPAPPCSDGCGCWPRPRNARPRSRSRSRNVAPSVRIEGRTIALIDVLRATPRALGEGGVVTDPCACGGERDRSCRRLLAFLGAAMVATGQPVDEVEDELREVGRHLGVPDVQVAAGPTGVHVGLASGDPATFESVDGRLRLDQSADVRLIRHLIVTGRIDVEQALDRLRGLRGKPQRYPAWLAEGGLVAVAVGLCLILQPGSANLGAAAVGAVLVIGLSRLARLHASLLALLPTVAAFAVSAPVFAAAAAGLLDGALRTVLPPLAVLLPGALMVTGLSELAAGAMVAGSARLVFGTVQLLLFALGVAAAAALLGTPAQLLGNVRVTELGWWAAPLGLLVIGVGITLMESVPVRLTPWVSAVLVVTFLVQLGGQRLGAPVLGSFLGAAAASIGASAAELVHRQLPRLVVFLPSFWLLVPGSLGLIGVSEVVIMPGEGSTVGIDVVGVILAIAMGLLVGSVVSRALRALVGRLVRTPG